METENNTEFNKIGLLNVWANENFGNEELKDKIFIAKVLYFLCSSSNQSSTYNDIIAVLLYDNDNDILKFLEMFRGEIINDENGKKMYHLFYKIDDVEEELIAMLNIGENESTTVN